MRRVNLAGFAAAFVIVGWAAGAYAVDPTMQQMQNAYVQLTQQIGPFVVNINAEGTTQVPGVDMRQFNDLFKFFGMPFGPQGTPNLPKEMRTATGSGFIYDKQGHIITNNHVVKDADKITVKLSTGKEYEAKVVGRDPDTDVAVIKIEPDGDLPVAVLGDSDKIKVGEYAIACGSPGGLEGSFAFGHVSALRRNELNLPGLRFENFIQTDAAINLGNSGGPLCNINGEVIGINEAIVFGANSLGFAIPINTAKDVVPTLIAKGKISRGFLGVGVTDVREFADALGLPDKMGAFVKTVEPGSPAEKAGVKPYDVVRKVNGEAVENASDLVQKISAHEPGTAVKIEVWREKKPLEIEAKIGEFAASATAQAEAGKGEAILGLEVENVTPDIAQRLQLKAGETGVLVTDVDPTSPAGEAGIQEGDIIIEVAQQKVSNTGDFKRLMKANAQPGKSVLIAFNRDGQHDITVIKVPK